MVWDDHCTVFLVHLFNFPEISAIFNDIVIELVERPYGCPFGTGKVAQWMEKQIIDTSSNYVYSKRTKGCTDGLSLIHI